MDKILAKINSISQRSGEIISYLILPLIGVVVYTAFMRYILHQAPDWGFEISLFIYGIYFMLAGAYCLLTKSHVAIDILSRHIPIRGQKILEIINNLVIFFVCTYMFLDGSKWAWRSTKIFEHSIHQTVFNPPIWWYKWLLPISAMFIAFQAFSYLFSAIQSLLNLNRKRIK